MESVSFAAEAGRARHRMLGRDPGLTGALVDWFRRTLL